LLITVAIAAVFIIAGNIAEAIWILLLMLSFMITLLFINKRKYFNSKEWNAIKYSYAEDIKMVSALSEPPMTKVTGFPFFRNGTLFLSIRVISQLEGMTPLSHRNIPKIRKSLNTLT
jgi:hypothetical protein